MTETSGEKTDAEYQDVSEEIQANTQPSLDGNSHVICSIFKVQSSLCIFDRSFLESKRIELLRNEIKQLIPPVHDKPE